MTFGSHALKWFHLLFDIYMQMTCDLDEEVKKVPRIYPYIAMVEGESNVQFFQVAETAVIGESDGFYGALIDLVCVCISYNIVYPKPLYPVLLFVQHYVMDIKDRQSHLH